MGDPAGKKAAGDNRSIWKIASISTATPRGRAAALTAARAWRPLSPNTSTIRSEQPLTTSGWSVKSGVDATKPVSFTTRAMRSSDPAAARACASSDSPQARALR